MRKWVFSGLLLLFALFWDTAILPQWIVSPYLPPLCLVLSATMGMVAGIIPGLLFGLISGLMSDVSAGVLGDLLFPAMAAGLGFGLLSRRRPGEEVRLKHRLFRLMRAALVFLLIELALLFYQYYQIDRFEWSFARIALTRAGIALLEAHLFLPVSAIAYFGTWRTKRKEAIRQEKTF